MKLAGWLVVLVVAGWLFVTAQSRRIDGDLQKAASILSRRLPMVLDHHTRLDQITAQPGRIVVYKATLIDVVRDQPQLASKVQALKPRIIEALRTREAMKPFRDGRVTMKFRYYDWWGKFLTEVVIYPNDF